MPELKPKREVDRDGVVRIERESRPLGPMLALGGFVAVVLAIGLVVASDRGPSPPPPEEPIARAPRVEAPRPAEPEPAASPRPRPAPAPVAVRAEPPPPPAAPEPEMTERIPPEGRSGMAVFPAPGTKPIKLGLVVPEGFPLPPGYVRHYQTTDEGKMLPAILMFHPDHAAGRRLGQADRGDRGSDRSPELAPQGMPIEQLTLPDEEADR